jgi:hypothetical protein
MEEKTWDQWEDCRGNFYQPGDIVAIAIINGKSPQMVLARVERINRVNSSGELIWTNKTFELDEPVHHERECSYKRGLRNRDRYYEMYYSDHVCKPYCTEWVETTEIRKVPSCTVKATPILDARGFGRATDHDGKTKAVTYSIPENIILIERAIDL